MFDLPVGSKRARRRYTVFRKELLKKGFLMLQFSVYARYYASEEASQPARNAIRFAIPPRGQVRLLAVTDHQFSKMEVFQGKREKDAEKKPEQLILF